MKMAGLRVKSGPLTGQSVEVTNTLSIGREDADLTIEDDELSRHHAVVRLVADGLQVEDLGSKNGTFVDGRRISEPTTVSGGSELKLGRSVFEVVVIPEAGVTVLSPAPAVVSPVADVRQAGPGAAPPLSKTPIGVFHPPGHHSTHLASRSWIPVVLSFGTAILTAVALVIYFAAR
jgi:pSer/pThr/pTyr-binding forkhead associated (FHA) protein